MNESLLISSLTSRLLPAHSPSSLLVGPGDDCAITDTGDPLRLQLLKTDAIASGIHFAPDTPPHAVGWKALARAISDIAAMGGTPDQALITLAFGLTDPPDHFLEFAENLYAGINACAQAYHVQVCGGEISRLANPGIFVNVALTGWIPRGQQVLRSTALPGHHILVTGTLGGSFPSGHHLAFAPRLNQGQWLASRHIASSMMDLSDGLAADLPKLAASSNVAFRLDPAAIPCRPGFSLNHALNDGEDFELLFTSPSLDWIPEWQRAFPDTPVTPIGSILPPGSPLAQQLDGGWDHLCSSPLSPV